MALSYQTIREIPYLPTYAAASLYEAQVVPIRGDAEKRKPLGRRSQKWQHIKRDLTTGSIEVYRGSRKMIEFHVDGNIGIYGPTYWCKASEGEVLNAVLGWEWRSMDHKMWIHTQTGWHPLTNGEMNMFEPVIETKITHVGHRKRMVQETVTAIPTALKPVTLVTHHINREGKREVMRKFKAYAAYVESMAKLRADTMGGDGPGRGLAVTDDEACDTFGFTEWKRYDGTVIRNPTIPFEFRYGLHHMKHPQAKQMAEWMLSDDPTDQYKAYLCMFRGHYLTEVDQMMQTFRNVLNRVVVVHYHKQCLTEVEVPQGAIVRDRYSYAIPA